MTPEQQFVLDTIAEGEAPDYNTLYRGHKFKSTAKHPGIKIPIGKTGLHSTAAGRYQFLESTWNAAAEHLGLEDFSPKNQDKAAWWLAQRTYRQRTGRELEDDAKKEAVEWNALTKQWPSLTRLTPQAQTLGAANLPAQVTAGPAPGPEIFNQLPAGNDLGYRPMLAGRGLTPVDYDPFAQGTP